MGYTSDAVLEGKAVEGEDVIGDEEGIADVIESSDAEDHVTDGTDGEEAAEVEDGTAQGEVPCDIVDGGDSDDDNGPDGGDEESQMKGHTKGIERGMVVEMTPRLRAEELDGAVEDGRGGHQKTKGRRIERGDIVEVYDLRTTSHQTTNTIGRNDNHTEGQEHEQVDIGEEVDELADRIVW